MVEKWLMELTRETVAKVDEILLMGKSEYIKEFGCEQDRVDDSKVQRAEILISTLKFFIDKSLKDTTAASSKTPVNG